MNIIYQNQICISKSNYFLESEQFLNIHKVFSKIMNKISKKSWTFFKIHEHFSKIMNQFLKFMNTFQKSWTFLENHKPFL
jgi:hypothetical protein